ncbi:MAG: prepilin-type N-terminal cleavage/methylation domain-containing protein [Verrucomicrobiota bacterium]|jgi:prepilin-type processing-associated H-X9-DG protein
MTLPRARRSGGKDSAAFTLVELLAVMAALALLAAVLLPALARAGGSRQGASCLNNLQQLGRALQLYAGDYATYLPPNGDYGSTDPYSSWVCGEAGMGGLDEFNPDILKDPTRSLLVSYLNGDASVFHCPSDLRTGLYQGTDPALTNTIVPSARSYSMSQAVGTLPYSVAGQGVRAPVYGPWLSGNHSEAYNAWFTFARTTDMSQPGPANTFVFLDEDPYSINDGSFSNVGPNPANQQYFWIDWPATYHGYGANFAFGDGHVETHTWQDARTQVQNGNVAQSPQPGNPDIVWLAEHTSALVPTNPPALSAVGPDAANNITISLVPGRAGFRYYLYPKDSLSTAWSGGTSGLTNQLVQYLGTNGGPVTFTVSVVTNSQRFYEGAVRW